MLDKFCDLYQDWLSNEQYKVVRMRLAEDGFPEQLSTKKLQIIVGMIKEAREQAFERNDVEWGDDNQVLGIRAYKRVCKLFVNAEANGLIDGFEVHEPKRRLTFLVDEIPLRFWRNGSLDEFTEDRRLVYSPQVQMCLWDEMTVPDPVDRWAINYETDLDGLLIDAFLVGYNSITCQLIRSKRIPIMDDKRTRLVEVVDELPQAETAVRGKIKLRIHDSHKLNEQS